MPRYIAMQCQSFRHSNETKTGVKTASSFFGAINIGGRRKKLRERFILSKREKSAEKIASESANNRGTAWRKVSQRATALSPPNLRL